MSEEKGNMLQAGAGKSRTLAQTITSDTMKKQWAMVLPQCLTPDRLARVALSQMRRVPKLAQCTEGSFLNAMMGCAELGLEPNGRHAHLIPYGKECQLIIDYKGLVELAMRSGKVSRIHADVVCENDTISIKNGEITHEINPLKDRGAMVGAYAMCFFKDGTAKHEYMSKAEVDSIRKRSKAGNAGPWVTDYNEMSKKTVFRRMSKWLPLSPEVQDKIIARDSDVFEIDVSDIDVSGPVYEEPEVSAQQLAVPNDPPASAPPPAAEKKPVAEKKADAALDKTGMIAEIEEHKDWGYYEDVVALHMPPECELSSAPDSLLRDILKSMRGRAASLKHEKNQR